MTSLDEIRKRKLAQTCDKIEEFIHKYSDEFNKINPELKQKILVSKAYEIKQDICEHKLYSSKTVVLIYCFASVEAHRETNCLTEIMFEEAIDTAIRLDEYLKQSRVPAGVFHGIPFSIKDTFDIKGFGTVETQILLLYFHFS